MTQTPPALVPALARGTAIVDLLAQEASPLTLSQISRQLGLPKSTTHGLCETLVQLDLIRPEGKGFRIGARALGWAQAFARQSDLLREFHYQIGRHDVLSGFTVSLSQLEGGSVTYLASHPSAQPLGISFQPGLRLPSVFTASGKAMLAALPASDAEALLPQPWPTALTAQSVTQADWPAQRARWQALGYGIDDEELRVGMVCLGVSIGTQPLGGLALSMTRQEAEGCDHAGLVGALQEVAQLLAPLYRA